MSPAASVKGVPASACAAVRRDKLKASAVEATSAGSRSQYVTCGVRLELEQCCALHAGAASPQHSRADAKGATEQFDAELLASRLAEFAWLGTLLQEIFIC